MAHRKNKTEIAERKWSDEAQSIALKKEWRLVADATMRMFDGSSLYYFAGLGRHYNNHVFGPDWEYVEVIFGTRKDTWRYAVMSVELPRKLPNVMFDSLKHDRQQFRFLFEGKQRIQLEGNFDAYFATYFGTGYAIDDLSFITPEVMLALIDATKYDIEIVHNKLILIGNLEAEPIAQITEMEQLIHAVRKKLMNNIVTYRDERLPFHLGRKQVAREGMFLNLNSGSGFGLIVNLVSGALIVVILLLVIEYALDVG